MRDSRSGFSPRSSRSISCSISGGITFFSRKARPRKIIVVTETIEQASSGHMNRPPLVKNPMTVFMAPGVSASIHEHGHRDRKSTRLNSSHGYISYAVFCLKKKKKKKHKKTQ